MFAVACFAFLTPAHAVQSVPYKLNFQGRLANSSGVALTGSYDMQFKLYTASSGGTYIWGETRTAANANAVTVTNGLFSVLIGEGTAVAGSSATLQAAVTANSTMYIEVTVGAETLTPRRQVGSSVYAFNSDTLDGLDSTDFIRNSTGVQSAANLSIDGTARADTSMLTPTLDTNTATALNIGTTNATVINLNENVAVAAAKTLTMTGSTTANRPGSPTDGMIYYDTDTKELVRYNGTKWISDGSEAYLVAASNSSQADKDAADYVATGSGDQTTIQSAVNRADPASAVSGARKSGKVYLFAGTYTTSDVISLPNNITFSGAGRGTLIQFSNIAGQTKDMITNSDTTTGTGITVRDIQLDGNASVNTTGTMNGIYFNGVGNGSGSTARQGANILGVWSNNFRTNGMRLSNSPNSTIIGNNVQGNAGSGIYISSSNRSNITNNISQGNSGSGIVLAGAVSENVVANTLAVNAYAGILINGSSNNNTIFGNNLYNNGSSTTNNAIYFPTSSNGDNNTISNNTINDTSGTANNYAINFEDNTSNSNYLTGNIFTSTAGTSTINDSSSNNNVYINQPRSEGGGKITNRTINDIEAFTVQSAAGTNVLAVDTTNAEVEIGSYNGGTNPLAGKLVLANATNANTVTLKTGTTSASYTLTLPTAVGASGDCLKTSDASGTLTFGSCPANSVGALDGGTANSTGATITSNVIYLQSASDTYAGLVNTAAQTFTGAKTFKTTSASALVVQNASAVNFLTADTSNSKIQIGSSTTDATAILLVADSYNQSTDPTGVAGGMYYNTSSGKFRCYENSAWKDCVTALPLSVYASSTTSLSSTSPVNVTDMVFSSSNLAPNTTYHYKFVIRVRAGDTTSGFGFGVTMPTGATTSYCVTTIATKNSATGGQWAGYCNNGTASTGYSSYDSEGTSIDYPAIMEGYLTTSSTIDAGLQLTGIRQDTASTVQVGSFGVLEVVR